MKQFFKKSFILLIIFTICFSLVAASSPPIGSAESQTEPGGMAANAPPVGEGFTSVVRVLYKYYDAKKNQNITRFEDYTVESEHEFSSYVRLDEEGTSALIAANQYPGILPVSTDELRFRVLAGEADITDKAAYDTQTGYVSLPGSFYGQSITIEWYCPASDVVELPVKVDVMIAPGNGGESKSTTIELTLPSNADTISVPLQGANNVVVTQNMIDFLPEEHTLSDGTLTMNVSAVGGDVTVSAVQTARTRGTGFTTVVHDRQQDNSIDYGYITSYYVANGNPAFCLSPVLSGVADGNYTISANSFIQRGGTYDVLIKAAYYLYGGPGWDSVKNNLFGSDANRFEYAYGLSHAAAAYIYLGLIGENADNAFKGLNSSTATHLRNVVAAVGAQPMPPDGFDVFLYGSGNPSQQMLMGWNYTPAPPVGSVEIEKTSSNPSLTNNNPCYSLAGAVYDVYTDGNVKVGSITTGADGKGRLDGLASGAYYIVEVVAPQGFALDSSHVSFSIVSSQTTTVKVTDTAQTDPVGILLRKLDSGSGASDPQGNASLEYALFTVKFYKGYFYTEAELAGVAAERTWVFFTDADGYAVFSSDYLAWGDSFYYFAGDPTLPLGTVTIQETSAPTGYLIDNTLFIRQITSEGNTEEVYTYNAPIVPETVIRGGVSVTKFDSELNTATPQGDATLAGAVFEIVNRSEEAVLVGGASYVPGAVVHTMTTDAAGVATTVSDLLPYGRYEVIEKTPPGGYRETGKTSQIFNISANGTIVNLNTTATAIKNDPIRGGVSISKYDAELNTAAAQGDATLAGAVLEIFNRSANSVRVNGTPYAPGAVVHTMVTDATGSAATANDLLPYGNYEIIEETEPTGYLNTGKISQAFSITAHGVIVNLTTSTTAIKNNPIRGGVSIVKYDAELNTATAQGGATLAGAVFE
ncbi:MAG TPA: hypothetical protein DEB31_10490, partial [Clostridiales bacterium]|nr:hypothetical protein [Clostridiales bacterium]